MVKKRQLALEQFVYYEFIQYHQSCNNVDSLSAKTVSQQRLVLAASVPEPDSRSPPELQEPTMPGVFVPSATCDPAGQHAADLQKQLELEARRVDDERAARHF